MTEAAPPPDHDPNDEALAAGVARHDAEAFACLYDRYAKPVYALAAHLLGPAEAEDVVQEAFARLWHRAVQYDPGRGAFGAWFMAVARHQVLAEVRRRGRDPVAAAVDVEAVLARAVDPASDVEEAVWQAARGETVRRALAELPDEQRRVLVLAYFGGLSQSAIARTLGWPLGTVKKRTRLGMQKLRGALRGEAAPSVGTDAPRLDAAWASLDGRTR